MKIKIIKTARGNTGINCDKYNYRKDRTLTSEDISWRCVVKKCLASLKSCNEMKTLKSKSGTHNHLPAEDASPQVDKPQLTTSTAQTAQTQTPSATPNTPSTSYQTPEMSYTPSLTETLSPYVQLTPVTPKHACLETENQHLRQRVAELEYMIDALTNKAIDLEKELLKMRTTSVASTEISTQTDPYDCNSQLMKSICTQTQPLVLCPAVDQETQTESVLTTTTSSCNRQEGSTQTDSKEQHNTTLQVDLQFASIKTRQNQMESLLKDIQNQLYLLNNKISIALNPSKTTSPSAKYFSSTAEKNSSVKDINQYSVSLQVAKSKFAQNFTENEMQPHTYSLNSKTPPKSDSSASSIQNKNKKLKITPPLNAVIRTDNQSLEDFYDKNIEFFKNLNNPILVQNVKSNHFLENTMTSKEIT